MNRRKARNQVRIIAGRHRGRRINFPEAEGLRPTGDRVRETLFNWLQPLVEGARCLDLFAGSGSLGFEAWSRGASEVVMLDQHPAVVQALEVQALQLGGSERVRVIRADALEWLQAPASKFDIVFLDPPFVSSGLLSACCEALERGGWLKPAARVYLETDREMTLPSLPCGWERVRQARAGQVAFYLVQRIPAEK